MLRGLCLARGTRLFTEVGRSPPLSASRHVFYACRRKLESSRSCTGRLHHDHHQGPTHPAQACQRPKLSRRDPTWRVFFRLVQGRRPTHVCWSSFLTALCLWVLWLRVPAAKEGCLRQGHPMHPMWQCFRDNARAMVELDLRQIVNPLVDEMSYQFRVSLSLTIALLSECRGCELVRALHAFCQVDAAENQFGPTLVCSGPQCDSG